MDALRIGVILTSLLGACNACFAQDRANTSSQSPSTAPQPAAEMLSLEKALVGKWSTTYEIAPGGSIAPAGGAGSGEVVWRTSPGAFVLMEEEHVRAPFGETFLLALFWWDKSTNSLRSLLCNNTGPAACNVESYSKSTLKWDGKRLTLDVELPQRGTSVRWHVVWSDFTPTSFTEIGEVGEAGGPLTRAFTAHGTKIAESSKDSGK